MSHQILKRGVSVVSGHPCILSSKSPARLSSPVSSLLVYRSGDAAEMLRSAAPRRRLRQVAYVLGSRSRCARQRGDSNWCPERPATAFAYNVTSQPCSKNSRSFFSCRLHRPRCRRGFPSWLSYLRLWTLLQTFASSQPMGRCARASGQSLLLACHHAPTGQPRRR